tara:strand:+ start:1431 stop:2426 length:996 start_codon:yes stop_codon:yes gene_type:complete
VILIIGANGFFGNQLQKLFLKKKIKFFPSDISLKNESYLDIRDLVSIKNFFSKNKITIVINCSCEPATSKSKRKLWDTNVRGNQNLIKACEEFKIKKYIYISTSAIWVKNYKKSIKEDEEYCPVENYGNSKVQAEKDIKKSNLINWTIFRVPMIVSKDRLGILSLLFDLILSNKKIPLLESGKNILQFLHAEDLSNCIYLSLNANEKSIYNLGSEEKISLKDLVEKLILNSNSKSKIISIKDFGVTKTLSFLNKLNLSPLNIYHLNMLKYSLTLNSDKIYKNYNYKPEIKTSDMILEALQNYQNKSSDNKINTEITNPIRPGIFKLIKLIL